jgi:hypothetical protein
MGDEAGPVPEPPQTTRSLWRVAAVALLSLFTIVFSVTDIVLPLHPTAQFGFQVDSEGRVLGVVPGSPAAIAGIAPGDVFDMRATPFDSRRYLQTGSPNCAQNGAHGRFTFVHGAERRTVDLVARIGPQSVIDNATASLVALSELGLVAIAAFLVLKRPSRMTWAFLLYANTSGTLAVTTVSTLPIWALAAMIAVNALYVLPWLWLALFALRFPNDDPTGWRRGAERALLLSLIAIVPLDLWYNGGYLAGFPPPPAVVVLFSVLGIAGLLFAAGTFVATYLHATPVDRARLRWVMVGIVVGSGGGLVYNILTTIPGIAVAWPVWLLNLMQAAQIVVGVTVAYAVVRHRVFDVRFFVGRAVLYSTLTSAVIAILQVVDFAAGKFFSSIPGLASAGQAGGAVLLGLSLKLVHDRLEQLIDSTFFKSRLLAGERLKRVARGLSHAPTLDSIQTIVVQEPASAYKLTSAAIFVRAENGRYELAQSVGWDDAGLSSIGEDESLVMQLLATRKPVPLADVPLPPGALPSGSKRPTSAIPMILRADLEAILFYGPHDSQEELDPTEMDILEDLLASAASAYDHVRAALLHEKLARLETQVETLRGSLGSAA